MLMLLFRLGGLFDIGGMFCNSCKVFCFLIVKVFLRISVVMVLLVVVDDSVVFKLLIDEIFILFLFLIDYIIILV